MKKFHLRSILILALAATLFSFEEVKGWLKLGSQPGSYEMGVDKGNGRNGKNAATIKSIDKHIKGFGTLMQQVKPDNFRGKKIKLSGWLKTENVSGWSGFWMRVDQAGSKEALAFDNMENRPVKGNTDWKKYDIVVEVPEYASLIAYGALLQGTGQIWFDNVVVEEVGADVPVTGYQAPKIFEVLEHPVNLDFEE